MYSDFLIISEIPLIIIAISKLYLFHIYFFLFSNILLYFKYKIIFEILVNIVYVNMLIIKTIKSKYFADEKFKHLNLNRIVSLFCNK